MERLFVFVTIRSFALLLRGIKKGKREEKGRGREEKWRKEQKGRKGRGTKRNT
jgi:hypothetical protein